MKKFLLPVLFFVFLGITGAQTLLLNENFEYGTSPNGDITAASTNWARHSGAQGPQYLSTSLTFAGYPSSGIGGSVGFTSSTTGVNDGDANRTFTDVTTTSTIYAAFLVNLASAKASTDYFFHVGLNPVSTSVFRGKVFSITNGAGWNIGVSKMATSTPTMDATVLNFNQTYLVVVKYEYNTTAADDDKVSLSVYSTMPTSEASAKIVTINSVNDGASDPTDIGSVMIRQGGNCATGTIDGIRIANNWGLAVTGTATDVADNISGLPTKFDLLQNYPNPFNPSTLIKYQVPQNTHVNISVYDILGNKISTLVNQEKAAGSYELSFNADNMPSGVYFYTIQTGSFTQTKKMILMK